MKKKIGNLITIIAIIVGVVLIAAPIAKNYFIADRMNQNLIKKVSKKDIERNKKKKVSYDWDKVKSLDTSSVIKLKDSPKGLPVIGAITIPELGMNLPIYKGVSDENMSYGASTMSDEQEMGQGNYSLISHHVFGLANARKLLFSPLDNAKAGQKIYITDKANVYQYNITEVFTVSPSQTDVVNPIEGRKVVTLITCTDINASGRLIVRGDLVATYDYKTIPKDARNGFNLEYQTLAV